ncbi:hypothetical protein GYA27_04430 [candidate division WWE3 bacterium]|uniref:Uncharacterized protein n=1 Tax=candidate division WWE3 bacterium TaxID=2053526 RepID=A0A7X9DL40_UNCKA|nr:hypothetical protein [candidate division WWE3 bacterium]
MQENETPIQTVAQPEQKNNNKDYLAPALVFIALFFSFFVLITMQRLTRKVIDGEDSSMVTTPQPVIEMLKQTSDSQPSREITIEEQMEIDSKKNAEEVGNDIINDIDATTTTDVEGVYDERNLQDLEE